MKMNQLKWTLGTILPIALSAATLSPQAWAGGESGGGGDGVTEMRIDEIRADILKWIGEGGGSELELPAGLAYEYYRDGMNRELQRHAVVIGSVTTAEEAAASDPELKVLVRGQPKTCRAFLSSKDMRPHILCNVERFAATPESMQYALIHHEYAGLAMLERNDGASSDYSLSSQITEYLVPETVLKLAVRKPAPVEKEAEDDNGSAPDLMSHQGGMIGAGGQASNSGNGVQGRANYRFSSSSSGGIISAEGDAAYTAGSGKASGLSGRARGFFGGRIRRKAGNGCVPYVGLGAQADGSRVGDGSMAVNIGPEAGAYCQVGKTAIMAGGVIAAGQAAIFAEGAMDPASPDKRLLEPTTAENVGQVGGRARVVRKNLTISADAFMTPKKSGKRTDWTANYGSINAQLKHGSWAVNGYAKGLELEDNTGRQKTVKAVEAGAAAGFSF
jgi:hypothetical protein